MKKIPIIIIIILASMFGFGQNTKNIDPTPGNNKTSGMRMNNNVDKAKNNQTAKPALNLLNQTGTSNSMAETYEKDAVFAGRNPKDEVLERRDRTSKHFRNADGSFEAMLSTGSVNYLEKGQWLTIERAILPNNTRDYPEYEFANTKNSFKTYLSTNQSKGIKTVIEGQEISEWQNKKIEFLDENLNLISAIKAENGKLNTNDAKAIYSNIFPYTEAHITQLFDGRKIDYEISSSDFLNHIPANSKYVAVSEEIFLPKGWNAKYYIDKLNENPTESKKQISVFNEKGEEVLRYLPPAYFEKNNEHDIENPIGDYEIEQVGQILTVKILVETDWLRSEERVFPVVIDPTFTVATPVERGYCNAGGSGAYNTVRFGYISSSWTLGYCSYDISTFNSAWSPTNVTITMTGTTNGTIAATSTASFQRVTVNPSDYGTWASYYAAQNAEAAYATYAKGSWAGAKDLGAPAVTRFIVDMGTAYKKFTVGFKATGSWNNNSYATYTGYTLAVTYTIPSGPPSCTSLISPANNSTSHSPGDPLTWTAASGATSYDVYFGTSSNPPYVTNVGTTSYSPTLAENTTYYWKIVPKNANGTPTGCSIWEFKTGVAPVSGDYRSRNITLPDIDVWSDMYGGGTWQTYNGSSWVNTSTPPNSTTVNVLIRAGSKILIDDDFQCKNLTIEGLIQFDWRGAKNLTVNGDVIMFGNGDFQTSSTGDQYEDNTFQKLFHRLYVKGNIYNNTNADHGIMFCDLNTFGYDNFSSLVEVRFRGSGNSEWSGTGENDIGGLSIEKDNANNVVTIKPDQLLGWHSNNLDGNGFFMYDKIEHKGTLKIGGTYTLLTRFGINSDANAVHDARQLPRISSLSSGNNFTLIIDNPNFGITGFTSVDCYGNLQIKQGNMNVGSGLGNYIEFYNGSSLIIDGGTLTSTGSINYRGTGSFNLTLSAGKIRAGFFGNSLSNTRGWFDVRNNATVNISGGEIHLINSSASTLSYPMYNMQAANVTITGGKLLIGSDASPNGTNTFTISGPTPSIELYSSGSIKSNAIMWGNVQCYGYLNIPLNCEFLTYKTTTPFIFSIIGNIDHKGKLYAEVENSKILFNGTSAQTFNSTGTYNGTTGISILEVNNSAGVLLTGSGTIVKNLLKTNGTFNIGSCYLNLYGNVTRTDGYLGGTASSMLNIYGTGNVGNLYFDPTLNKLKTLKLDRTSSGIINLATNLNVEESITFTNGLLYTYKDNTVANGSKTIFLAPTAELLSENINSYIYGKVSISNAANATFGNIGATMSSLSGLGNTSLTRITGTEGIQTVGDGLASIACYWDIQVQNQPSSALNTTFKWLSPFDNSLPTTDMQAYTLRTPNPWETVGNATTVTGDPRSITVDATHFSIWTVSKKSTPLPVELLSFAAECKGNSKEFTWETASEINSDYFEIMASANGKNFVAVAKIPAAGNSSQNRKYTHTLRDQNDKTYYRLKQTDFDGKFEYFNPTAIHCNSNFSLQINIYPNPAQKELYCSIVTDKEMDVEIQIVNYLGQICYVKNHSIGIGTNTLDISPPYNSGIYLVKVISNSTVIETKKIIIQ